MKRKILTGAGKIASFPVGLIVAFLVVLLVVLFAVVIPMLKSIGLLPDAQAKQADKAAKYAAAAASDAAKSVGPSNQQQYALQRPSFTEQQYSSWANQLHETMRRTPVSDDYEKAGIILTMMKNDSDVHKLIEHFGIRDESYFFLPAEDADLPTMVKRNLSQNKLNLINDNYRRKGIKFRF